MCRENRNTFCVQYFFFFFRKSCRLRNNVEKYCRAGHRPQKTMWRMRIACWLPKVTDTHSEYVIPIAFPRQKWLHERASMLRYTDIACLVSFSRAREFVCFYSEFHNTAASGWWSQDLYRRPEFYPRPIHFEFVEVKAVLRMIKFFYPRTSTKMCQYHSTRASCSILIFLAASMDSAQCQQLTASLNEMSLSLSLSLSVSVT
jgi:hypothetical protein